MAEIWGRSLEKHANVAGAEGSLKRYFLRPYMVNGAVDARMLQMPYPQRPQVIGGRASGIILRYSRYPQYSQWAKAYWRDL